MGLFSLPLSRRPAIERHIVLSDYHIRTWVDPYTREVRRAHCPKSMALVEKFIREWAPTHEWLNGDFLDAHQASSKFCRDPRTAVGLERDLAELKALVARHADMMPDARRVFNMGNHDVRVGHYIAEKAPAIADLAELRFERLAGLTDAGYEVHEYGERVMLTDGVEITHGNRASARSGYTAHAEMRGYSGISGHTHRLAQVWRTDRRGPTSWTEGGCLCSLRPDYLPYPDWQQGFVTVTRIGDRALITPVPIQRSGDTFYLIYEGKVLEV